MGLEDGLAAIEALATIGRAWQQDAPLELPELAVPTGPVKMVDEDAAKSALSAVGIDVPKAHNSL